MERSGLPAVAADSLESASSVHSSEEHIHLSIHVNADSGNTFYVESLMKELNLRFSDKIVENINLSAFVKFSLGSGDDKYRCIMIWHRGSLIH